MKTGLDSCNIRSPGESGLINSETPENTSSGSGNSSRRKPLQLLTGIFTRKTARVSRGGESLIEDGTSLSPPNRGNGGNSNSNTNSPQIGGINIMWGSEDECCDHDHEDDGNDFSYIPEPREALHSPYHAKTIDQDMEHLRLSRQDNPYLQILASRESLHENDAYDDSLLEFEEKHLMSKENLNRHNDDPISLAEVHARLVRSPPPVMWTRSRNSEPSFIHLIRSHDGSTDNCIFQFPPSNHHHHGKSLGIPSPSAHSFRSHHSVNTSKFLMSTSNDSSSRQSNHNHRKDNSLELLTGKFNLSPQPRRKPGAGANDCMYK